MIKSWFPLLLVVFLIGGCFSGSDSDTGTGVSTGQLSASQAIQFYTDQIEGLQKALLGVVTCDQFFQILNSLSGETNCETGGSQFIQFFDTQCLKESPVEAETAISQNFQDCRSPGVSVTGEILGDFIWDGSQLDSQINATGFLFNGLPQSFSNLHIMIFSQNPPRCEGQILITSDLCPVTPDCQFCPL